MESNDQLAVVTGASSGIGLELARQFASNGFDVLMCAEDEAITAAAASVSTSGAPATGVVADLATPAGVEHLISVVRALGRPVDALALNAGVGNGGAFVDIPWEREARLIALNVTATVQLAKALVPAMALRGAGRVLFTASIAATMPGPFYATYAASKSFVHSFAEALRYELKDTGVTVTSLMPGPTDTEFFDRAGMQDTPVDGMSKDDPAEVAADGFRALMAGDDHVVAGSIKNKLQAASAGVLPDTTTAAMHARLTRPGD